MRVCGACTCVYVCLAAQAVRGQDAAGIMTSDHGSKMVNRSTMVAADKYSSTASIPPDIQAKINNRDIGLILLRIAEIIGKDKLENLGSETLNFILITLNQLDLDTIRDKIILKTLPIRV